jgi:ElaB/YqjD/DUF883 family membrane-anchored ribosome-binding protein
MAKSKILENLTADVEELLGKLGSDLSPEVRELRDRLDRGIAATKKSATRAGAEAGSVLQNYAGAADDYIHDSPWVAVGTAAAAAGIIGFVAGTLLASNRRGWTW